MSTAKYCSGTCRLAYNNAKRPKIGGKRGLGALSYILRQRQTSVTEDR